MLCCLVYGMERSDWMSCVCMCAECVHKKRRHWNCNELKRKERMKWYSHKYCTCECGKNLNIELRPKLKKRKKAKVDLNLETHRKRARAREWQKNRVMFFVVFLSFNFSIGREVREKVKMLYVAHSQRHLLSKKIKSPARSTNLLYFYIRKNCSDAVKMVKHTLHTLSLSRSSFLLMYVRFICINLNLN